MPFPIFCGNLRLSKKGVTAFEENRKYGSARTIGLRVNWMVFTLVNLRLPIGKHTMGAKIISSSTEIIILYYLNNEYEN